VTSPPKQIEIECPRCGEVYIDWYRPSMNLELDDFDEKYIDEASSAVCPKCGYKVRFETLLIEDLGRDRAAAPRPTREGDSGNAI
jgi:predicted RNA-binding Zn-ribbon protein involved in translation (DUF1610 family)